MKKKNQDLSITNIKKLIGQSYKRHWNCNQDGHKFDVKEEHTLQRSFLFSSYTQKVIVLQCRYCGRITDERIIIK